MNTTRRHFLKVIGAGTVGVATRSIAGCSDDSSSQPTGDVPAGNESQIPVGTLTGLGQAEVCIGHDSGGFYAMTLVCTHQGCNMGTAGTVSAAGIFCDCHGSKFDANGNVVQGPATEALRHFSVTADGSGDLTIHTGSVVDPSTRLAAS